MFGALAFSELFSPAAAGAGNVSCGTDYKDPVLAAKHKITEAYACFFDFSDIQADLRGRQEIHIPQHARIYLFPARY